MEDVIEKIRSRSEEVGECWEWQGCYQSSGSSPTMRHNGIARGVRRVLAEALKLNLKNGRLATVRCMNPRCVNPQHVHTVTRKVLQQHIAKAHPACSSPQRRRRLSIKARANSKLTLETVREIRQLLEDGVHQRTIAAQFGVSQNCISRIKRGVIWRDYNNPFLQLMR
jgi:transposase-like protein